MEIIAEVVQFKAAVDEWYQTHAAGGPLHIVLDDHNVETGHILWCLRDYSTDDWYETSPRLEDLMWRIAEFLLDMTEEERWELLACEGCKADG